MVKVKRKRAMATKDPKTMTRIDAALLSKVSLLAKAMNLKQYEAIEQAAADWIEKHKDECILRLPGTPPPETQEYEKNRDWVDELKSQSQE